VKDENEEKKKKSRNMKTEENKKKVVKGEGLEKRKNQFLRCLPFCIVQKNVTL
jgi:hypothetical protein